MRLPAKLQAGVIVSRGFSMSGLSRALLVAIAIMTLTVVGIRFAPLAQAQSPSDYTYSHTKRNLYTDEVLIYNFAGLTPSQQYSITAQQLDLLGNIVGTLGEISFTNLTSTQFIFPIDFNDTDSWKADFYPFRMIDNFGHVLSWHFMAPALDLEWYLSTSTTGADEKQGIAFTPYADVNSDGYHRNTNVLFAQSTIGDITLLHYTATSTFSTDEIRINDIQNLTTTVTLSLSEIIGYNEHDSLADPNAAEAYIVLNSDGHFIPFVDYVESVNEFVGVFDNPFYVDIATGVYDYPRYDSAGNLVSYGQNVWVLSEANPAFPASVSFGAATFLGTEWQMVAVNESVRQAGTQRVRFLQRTENVWNDYSLQKLTDSNLGTVDDTDYAYSSDRTFAFTASNTVGIATLTWIIQAPGLSVPAIDPFLFTFEITDTYTITSATAVVNLSEQVGGTLNLLALESPLGQVVAMLGLMLLLFLASWKWTQRFEPAARNLINVFIYLGVGGLFIYTQYASVLTITIWGVGAVFLIYTLARGTRQNA